MYAAVVADFTKNPVYAEFPDPEESEHTQVVEVLASAVHQIVRSIARGAHYSSGDSLPIIAGIDGIARIADGRRVYTGGCAEPWGMLAERAPVPAGWAIEVPDGVDDITAAAIVNPAASSWLPYDRLIAPGSAPTVVVNGATGASGTLAVEAARLHGAGRVVAAGRNREALEVLRSRGADAVIDVTGDVTAQLAAAAPDGVDLVLDYIWGPPAEAMLAAVAASPGDAAKRIEYVQIGALAGRTIALDASQLRSRNINVSGSGLGSVEPAAMMRAIPRILAAAAGGDLTIAADAHPLNSVGTAWDLPGRLVFVP